MKAAIVYLASDGSQHWTESEALHRDNLDAQVAALEAHLPAHPKGRDERVRVDNWKEVWTAVIELCRREFPTQEIFQNLPLEIHPLSYAGRLMSELGGPLNRIWLKFNSINDGWLYQQAYFAIDPEGRWKGKP